MKIYATLSLWHDSCVPESEPVIVPVEKPLSPTKLKLKGGGKKRKVLGAQVNSLGTGHRVALTFIKQLGVLQARLQPTAVICPKHTTDQLGQGM